MIKAGYPSQLVKLMIAINIQRIKMGLRPNSGTQRPVNRYDNSSPQNRRPARPAAPANRHQTFLAKIKMQINLTVNLFLLSVVSGNSARAWQLWDPIYNSKFSQVYNGMRKMYLSGYRFKTFNPPRVKFLKHPTYKFIAYCYIQFIDPNEKSSIKYFSLRLYQGRWVITFW